MSRIDDTPDAVIGVHCLIRLHYVYVPFSCTTMVTERVVKIPLHFITNACWPAFLQVVFIGNLLMKKSPTLEQYHHLHQQVYSHTDLQAFQGAPRGFESQDPASGVFPAEGLEK